MALNGRDVSFWPAPLRRAVDSIAVMRMQVYMIARGRAAASASPVVRTLAGRDEEAWKLSIRERELGVFRRRLEAMPAHKRPRIVPEDRFEVLQLMRLRGLSVKQAAERYVLHSNFTPQPNGEWAAIRLRIHSYKPLSQHSPLISTQEPEEPFFSLNPVPAPHSISPSALVKAAYGRLKCLSAGSNPRPPAHVRSGGPLRARACVFAGVGESSHSPAWTFFGGVCFCGGLGMATGKVKKVVVDRGFGFIAADDGKEYFFHHSAIRGGSFDTLRGGESCEFDIGQGPKGPRAENVRIVG